MPCYKYKIETADFLSIFAAFENESGSILFDSADLGHKDANFSYAAILPDQILTSKGHTITVTEIKNGQTRSLKGEPFDILRRMYEAFKQTCHYTTEVTYGEQTAATFTGGMAGLFSYDLARSLENIPHHIADNNALPDIAVGFYSAVLTCNRKTNEINAFIHAADKSKADEKFHQIDTHIKNAPHPKTAQHSPLLSWRHDRKSSAYMQDIERVIEYILEGDIFQANLAQGFEADLPQDFKPFDHYRALRRGNPAPFAGYMRFDDLIISSASPERFLMIDKNGKVETCPIKGTIARNPTNEEKDKNAQQKLLNSEKDRAENIMIVDLLRNDLSKCCTPESVEVTDLCKLESFTDIHHLVSRVQGKLKAGKDAIDLLQSCFPGGSITGAPKIRAMEIIEELEHKRRGPYCGAMAYFDFSGHMDSNILIRTMTFHQNMVRFQTGGGITAKSNPQDEYDETLDKAASLFGSFTDSSHTQRNKKAAKK